MKRLLWALCLFSGLANATPYTINVAFTYTSSAATAAGGATALQTQVTNAFNVLNTRYAASGVDINLVPRFATHAATTAPNDNKEMNYQYAWTKNSYEAAANRDNNDGNIWVHISNPPGGTAGQESVNPAGNWRDAVMVLPQASLSVDLEFAIGRVFGLDPTKGYANRARLYPSDPLYPGSGYGICYHSHESAPSNSGTVVPYLPYYQTGGIGETGTQSATPQAACDAWQKILAARYPSPSGVYVVADITTTPGYCEVWNTGHVARQGVSGITYSTPTGGSVIACSGTEGPLDTYSTPNRYYTGEPSLLAGDSTHNNVATMNTRAAVVFNYSNSNAVVYSTSQHWLYGWFNWAKWR